MTEDSILKRCRKFWGRREPLTQEQISEVLLHGQEERRNWDIFEDNSHGREEYCVARRGPYSIDHTWRKDYETAKLYVRARCLAEGLRRVGIPSEPF